MKRLSGIQPVGRSLFEEPRLQFTEQEFLLRSSRKWNSLPLCLRENENLVSFKKQMKRLLISRRQREPG